jgi:Inorganic pyrophosphatase
MILSRPIGMFRITDEKGGDDKILCVPAGDPRQENLRELDDVPDFYRLDGVHHRPGQNDAEQAQRDQERLHAAMAHVTRSPAEGWRRRPGSPDAVIMTATVRPRFGA